MYKAIRRKVENGDVLLFDNCKSNDCWGIAIFVLDRLYVYTPTGDFYKNISLEPLSSLDIDLDKIICLRKVDPNNIYESKVRAINYLQERDNEDIKLINSKLKKFLKLKREDSSSILNSYLMTYLHEKIDFENNIYNILKLNSLKRIS